MIFVLLLGSFVSTTAFPMPNLVHRSVKPTSHMKFSSFSSTVIQSSASDKASLSSASSGADDEDDLATRMSKASMAQQLLYYSPSLFIQIGLFKCLFQLFDTISINRGRPFHPVLVGVIFAFFSLRSRVFNILDNSRPDRARVIAKENNVGGFNDRKMPSWTPPGVFFPIMWLLIITPLRAVSSVLVYQHTGKFSNPALLALMLHLSIGDVWNHVELTHVYNHVNNIEKDYKKSVVVVGGVWLSVLHAVRSFYNVLPRAGYILAPSAAWISVASVLTYQIWQLNKKN